MLITGGVRGKFFSASPLSVFSEDCETISSEVDPGYCYPEPNFWCSLGYYELNSRVGELFKVSLYHFLPVSSHFPINFSHLLLLAYYKFRGDEASVQYCNLKYEIPELHILDLIIIRLPAEKFLCIPSCEALYENSLEKSTKILP